MIKRNRTNPLIQSKGLFIILLLCISTIILITIFAYLQNKARTSGQFFFEIIPEYNRVMEKIVISLPTKNSLVPALSLNSHFGLFEYIPEYTEILMILPESRVEEIKARLAKHPVPNKITMYPFKTITLEKGQMYLIFAENDKLVNSGLMENIIIPKGTVWAQDLFESAIQSNGHPLLLMPDAYKMFYSEGSDNTKDAVNVQPDNLFLKGIFSGSIDSMRTPLIFMGGNILVDQIHGKKIAFCGGDVLKDTQIVWRAYYEKTLGKEQFIKMVKRYLNVDKVYIIGKEKPQPSYMFHLDQAMILLPDGIVGITNIVGEGSEKNIQDINEIKTFLSDMKSLLKTIGYKTIDIDTSINGVLQHQFYINSIPYIDKMTGQKILLMPVSNEKHTADEKTLINKNISVFKSIGYNVMTVPSESTAFNGGIHCLINVIE